MLLGRQALENTLHTHTQALKTPVPQRRSPCDFPTSPQRTRILQLLYFLLSLPHSLLPLHSSSHTLTFFSNSPRIFSFLLC